jgi:hypothetical protein
VNEALGPLSLAIVLWLCCGCGQREPEVVAGRPANPLAKGGGAKAIHAAADEREIKELFERYWTSLATRKGDEAAACVERKTLEWFEQVRQDALKLNKEDLLKKDLQRRLIILQYRHEFDRDTLARSTGRELYARGIAKGWLEKFAKNKVTLSYVGSNGQSAHAMIPTAPDLPAFFFEKDPEGWRVNETRYHDSVRQKLQAAHAASGVNESEFIKNVLTEISGRKAEDRIFDGPLDKVPS